jgi:phage protein D
MDAPRAIVEVAGGDVHWYDLVEMKFENTLYLAADSFEATFRNNKLLSDWFRKGQEVQIYLGYVKEPSAWSKSELDHVFTGLVDGVKTTFGSSMTVELVGRDYSAPLIDTEYSVAYAERTSSQVAALLAAKYGIAPQVTDTTVIVEKELIADKKEWEVLQALADLEGFVCYVSKDKALYFGPRAEDDDNVVANLVYRTPGMANCEMDFDDSSVGVVNKVTIRHWMGSNKQLIEASAINQQVLDAMGGQVKERIIYEGKAKTIELAQYFADKRLKELSRMVVTGSGICVGNHKMFAEKRVAVSGCGRFDETYYIDKVSHEINKSSGYKCSFDITSVRPDSAEQYRQDLYDNKEKTT